MYPSSVRHSGGLNLAPQNFVSPPQYPDYGGYHVAAAAAAAANLDNAQSPGPSWPAAYGAPLREDWNGYAPGGAAAANAVAHGLNGGSPAAAMGYSSPADYHAHHHPHHHPHHPAAAPSCASGLLQTLNPGPPGPTATPAAEQLSPGGQRRNLCEWMRKPAQPSLGSQGKRCRGAPQVPRAPGLSRAVCEQWRRRSKGKTQGWTPGGGRFHRLRSQKCVFCASHTRVCLGQRNGFLFLTVPSWQPRDTFKSSRQCRKHCRPRAESRPGVRCCRRHS